MEKLPNKSKNDHIFWNIFRRLWNRAIIENLWNWNFYKNTFYSFYSVIKTMFQLWIENLRTTHKIWHWMFQEIHKISKCSISKLSALPAFLNYVLYFIKHIQVIKYLFAWIKWTLMYPVSSDYIYFKTWQHLHWSFTIAVNVSTLFVQLKYLGNDLIYHFEPAFCKLSFRQ